MALTSRNSGPFKDFEDSYIQSILDTLFDDPTNLPCCVQCFLAIVEGGLHAAERVDAKRFRQSHGLWNSIFRFLIVPRTDEQVQDLLDLLGSRPSESCPNYDSAFHQLGFHFEKEVIDRTCDKEANPATALILILFLKISYALEYSKVRSVAKRTSATWPTSPEDLMPWGAENLIESLQQWTRFTKDSMIYNVCKQIHALCGTLITDTIINSRFFYNVIDGARSLFDRMAGALRDGSAPRQRTLGEGFRWQSEGILFFFANVLVDIAPHVVYILMGDYEMKTVEVCSLLAYISADRRLSIPERDWVTLGYSTFAASFFYVLRHSATTLPERRVYPMIYERYAILSQGNYDQRRDYKVFNTKIREFHEKFMSDQPGDASQHNSIQDDINQDDDIQGDTSASVEEEKRARAEELKKAIDDLTPLLSHVKEDEKRYASLAVHYLRDVRSCTLRCSAPGCPNTIQTSGRNFQRCARCRVAPYCGRNCQIRAWNESGPEGNYSHRRLCKVMQNLVELGGGVKVVFGGSINDKVVEEAIADSWIMSGARPQDIIDVSEWAVTVVHPVSSPPIKEVGPGYEDYDARIEEAVRTAVGLDPDFPVRILREPIR